MLAGKRSWIWIALLVVAISGARCERRPDGSWSFGFELGLPSFLSSAVAPSGGYCAEPLAALAPLLRDVAAGRAAEAFEAGGDKAEKAGHGNFMAAVGRHRLDEIDTLLWTECTTRRAPGGSTALVEGLAERRGATEPVGLKLTLNRRDDAWKLAQIEARPGTKADVQRLRLMPTQEALRNAALAYSTAVMQSLHLKSAEPLHKAASKAFRAEYPLPRLDNLLKSSFASVTITGNPVEGLEPVWTRLPTIHLDNRLHLVGHFDIKGARYDFTYKMLLEDDKWELIGFDYEFVTPKQGEAARDARK